MPGFVLALDGNLPERRGSAALDRGAGARGASVDGAATNIADRILNVMVVGAIGFVNRFSAGTLDGPPEKREFLPEPEPEPSEKFGPPARARISP
ncbi:hypothetical protein L484_022669 [Morus notabilis]|uniref:Uncharacterized protein n=1 Tax=Morus notabilis TaxID=981085 RepID=W9RKU4_9ROSA|nr:hypothetical protein L484_022669 [Morus notabilis]